MTTQRQNLYNRKTSPLVLQVAFVNGCGGPVDLYGYSGKMTVRPRMHSPNTLGLFNAHMAEHYLTMVIAPHFLQDFRLSKTMYNIALCKDGRSKLVLMGDLTVLEPNAPYTADEDLDSIIVTI